MALVVNRKNDVDNAKLEGRTTSHLMTPFDDRRSNTDRSTIEVKYVHKIPYKHINHYSCLFLLVTFTDDICTCIVSNNKNKAWSKTSNSYFYINSVSFTRSLSTYSPQ